MRIIPNDIGRSFADVVRMFDDHTLDDDIIKVLRGFPIEEREIQNAENQWFLRRILPYRNQEGLIVGVVLIFPDITSIKKSDLELTSHIKQLQWQSNLLNQAAPIIGRDSNDAIIFWNKGAETLYGWTDQEAKGRNSHLLLKAEYPEPLKQIEAELLETGSWRGDVIHVDKSGEKLSIDSQWTTYFYDDGAKQAIIEVSNNITRRKIAQQALLESKTMFHTMMDWTYSWEYWVGQDKKLIYMTPSVERITGYTVNEFVRNPNLIDTIILKEDAILWERHKLNCLESNNKETAEVELRIVKKNGEICWINHICRLVIGPTGTSLGERVTVRDISTQKTADKQIQSLAYYDPLTHLPNRRLLLDRITQALASSNRSGEFGGIMMLDLDHFKQINDTAGHDIGDCLLVEVSNRLIKNVRQDDTVSRLGGDEFVILFENLGAREDVAANQIETVAEKIRIELCKPYVLSTENPDHYNSSSIGITLFKGANTSVKVIMKQADLALYEAKDAGRNVIRFFNPAMQAVIDARTAMLVALRQGIDRNQFQLFYQPQVNSSGSIIGAEALIRWFPEDGKCVTPADFIPLSEETDLILPIGDWIFARACQQLSAWQLSNDYQSLYISVNVSARQFHQADFVERVARVIKDNDVDPSLLKLELTETVVLDSIDDTIAKMHSLIKLGVSFSLDDFGTGYSSLSYLKQLPLSQVKIDKEFVHDVICDASDEAIVRAILAMSQSLELQVVAEGVETEEQLAFLSEYQCDVFQGYLFSRPMPIEEWDDFFTRHNVIREMKEH